MNEFFLLLSFFVIAMFALLLMFYPLRKSKRSLIILTPCFIIALCLGYLRLGSWTDWQKNVHDEANKEKIEAVLQSIKSPEELINRMKIRLSKEPENPKGWYLIGRIYASQGQWSKAHEAFLKSHQLNSDDELITVNYINSLLQLNNQHFNETIRDLLKELLTKNPNQADALAMVAIDSFNNREYQQAINSWQQLLKLAPEQSEEAKMVRKAIAKAQAGLKEKR
ncbi:MAG: tetratricopeptide repeat protein [Tatlockia sp.]|nr:tetratricopeptide repeat protein [Tatlockia sp.]